MPLLYKILLFLIGGGAAGGAVAYKTAPELVEGATIKMLAGGLEVAAGTMDVAGYIFFIAFILGWKQGGERVAIIWPLSIVLEALAYGLWNS